MLLGLMLVGCGATRPASLAYVAVPEGAGSEGSANLDVYLIEPQSQSITRLTSSDLVIETDPCLDAAHSRVAYAARPIGDPPGSGSTLQVQDLEAGTRRTVYTSKGRVLTPAWSNKGDRIAFCERIDGRYLMRLINADGTNLIDLGYGRGPSWSQDDRALFYSSRDAADAPGSVLMHRDLGTGVVTSLALDGLGFVNLQRGTSILYSTLPYSRRNEAVWLIDANNRQARLSEPGLDYRDLDPVFINGSTLVAFTRFDVKTGEADIYVVERYDQDPVAVPLVAGDRAAYTRGGELINVP